MRWKAGALPVLLVAVVCAVAMLAGCAGATSTMSLDIVEDTGALNVTVDNAGADNQVISSIVVDEGQCLVMSPVLDKGALRVVLEDSEKAVFDQEVSGKVMGAYRIDPGDYTLSVAGIDGNPATGTMLIVAMDIEELRQQDASLVDALKDAAVAAK